MIYSTMPKEDVVTYVIDMLEALGRDLQSIMITRLGKSGDFCVTGVINSQSDEALELASKRLDVSLNT